MRLILYSVFAEVTRCRVTRHVIFLFCQAWATHRNDLGQFMDTKNSEQQYINIYLI